MSSNKLLLVRGLPGSGKSTLAKEIESRYGFEHVETDMYFIRKDGDYEFDKTKIKEAHDWCYSEVKELILIKKDIVVSNTFTTFKEIEPYIILSKRFKYNFAVICCTGKYQNIHNVPEATIENMVKRFETIPGEAIRNV